MIFESVPHASEAPDEGTPRHGTPRDTPLRTYSRRARSVPNDSRSTAEHTRLQPQRTPGASRATPAAESDLPVADPATNHVPAQPPPPATMAEDVAAAKEKAAAFLASVRMAIQPPLAAEPPRQITPVTTSQTPRRSSRLAAQPLNTAVRASKKGEILAMKKLGIITQDHEAAQITDKDFDRFLVSTMQPRHFAALRDIFPAANGLTDQELLLLTSQACAIPAT